MIETKNLQVGYDKKIVIDDVCLTVARGQILTLIGPNGSGKSTILKSITKQLKTIGGSIYLCEENMKEMKDADVAKKLAMVMTERPKPELMTCREVVGTGRYPYTGRMGILTKEDWEKVDEAIAMVHGEEVANHPFEKISDGQRQRIMLARAICQEPEVLVLDEPTSFLDMRYKLDLLYHIRQMAKKNNIAVIMSLHELDLAQKVSDTIACVDGDKISKIGAPEDVFTGNYIQNLYGISEEEFDPLTGIVNLRDSLNDDSAEKIVPKVFIISGGGCGIPVFQRLQREGVPFAVGVLNENDVEYRIAKAMAAKVIAERAFTPIGEDKIKEAMELIASCESCICALSEFGQNNKENEKLKEYAIRSSKLG